MPESNNRSLTDKSTDLQLWNAIQAAEPGAWSILVRRYEALVYSIATRAGLSLADASDCFQQTWMLLFKHKKKINQPERLSAWLTTTAKREAIRIGRRQSRDVDIELLPEVPDKRPLADEEMESVETRARLDSMMTQLDPRCRKLLGALFLEPETKSYDEIARELGFPKNSMGPVRSRCMAKLRALVEAAGWI